MTLNSSLSPVRRKFGAVHVLLFTLAFFGSLFLFVPAAWEWMDTDDPRMQLMVSGVAMPDGPDAHVLYMHIWSASVLKGLYSQNADVPWYGLWITGTLITSWCLILDAVFSLHPKRSVVFALTVGFVTISTYFWTHLQFTTVATCVATAGMLQIVCAALNESSDRRFRRFRVVVGWLLVIYASLIREHSCYLIGVLSVPAVLPTVWKLRHLVNLKMHIGAALLALTMIVGLAQINAAAYRDNSEWQEFRRLEQPMAAVINNHRLRGLHLSEGRVPFPETLRERHQSTLEQMDWSGNDLQLFLMWYFNDPHTYTAREMRFIKSEMIESPWKDTDRLKFMVAATAYKLVRAGPFLVMFLLAITVAVVDRSASRRWTLLIVWGSTLFILWVIYVTAKLPDRVLVPASVAASLLTMVLPIRPDESTAASVERRGPFASLIVILFLSCCGYQIVQSWRVAEEAVRDRATLTAELKAVVGDADHFHVVLQPVPFSLLAPLDNNEFLHGWQYSYSDGHQRDPVDKLRLQQFGISNLTDAIAAGDRVRLIGPESRIQLLARFVGEHRGRQLRLNRIADGHFLDVYEVSSERLAGE